MERRGGELCQRCGLCCDGTLFGWVAVAPDEAPRFRLTVVGDTARLDQPCAHFVEASCSVYETRPVECARYRCKLLIKLEEGSVGFDAATAVVRRAKVLRDEMISALPAGDGDLWARIARANPKESIAVALPSDVPDWVMVAGALRGLLAREFADRFVPEEISAATTPRDARPREPSAGVDTQGLDDERKGHRHE